MAEPDDLIALSGLSSWLLMLGIMWRLLFFVICQHWLPKAWQLASPVTVTSQCVPTPTACPACLSDYVDQVAGGNVIQRLKKVSEFEVTVPNGADRLIMTAEVTHSAS